MTNITCSEKNSKSSKFCKLKNWRFACSSVPCQYLGYNNGFGWCSPDGTFDEGGREAVNAYTSMIPVLDNRKRSSKKNLTTKKLYADYDKAIDTGFMIKEEPHESKFYERADFDNYWKLEEVTPFCKSRSTTTTTEEETVSSNNS